MLQRPPAADGRCTHQQQQDQPHSGISLRFQATATAAKNGSLPRIVTECNTFTWRSALLYCNQHNHSHTYTSPARIQGALLTTHHVVQADCQPGENAHPCQVLTVVVGRQQRHEVALGLQQEERHVEATATQRVKNMQRGTGRRACTHQAAFRITRKQQVCSNSSNNSADMRSARLPCMSPHKAAANCRQLSTPRAPQQTDKGVRTSDRMTPISVSAHNHRTSVLLALSHRRPVQPQHLQSPSLLLLLPPASDAWQLSRSLLLFWQRHSPAGAATAAAGVEPASFLPAAGGGGGAAAGVVRSAPD